MVEKEKANYVGKRKEILKTFFKKGMSNRISMHRGFDLSNKRLVNEI